MITLVDYMDTKPARRVSRRGAARMLDVRQTVMFDMRALELRVGRTLSDIGQKRIFDAAVGKLSSCGIYEALCADDGLREEFVRRGIASPPPERIAEICFAEAAVYACDMLGAKSAAVYAHRRTKELERTVRALSARTRSLAVILDRGGEQYARELMYDCGLSIAVGHAALSDAELKVLFDATELRQGSGFAIGRTVRPEVGLRVVGSMCFKLPRRFFGSGYLPLEAASAAVRVGALRPGEVGISELLFVNSIDNSASHHYNAVWNLERGTSYERRK